MSGGLLSLKWNNHCSTFLQILSNLHKKQTYHDATVACGGALYPVHKIVLSTCSEYFEEMFDSINDKHPIIVLKDIKGEVFEALLKYMYIGEVNVIQDRLNDLINAAECLKIKGLAVPDEDPSEESARSNRSTSTNNNSSVSTKRRHEHSDSSNSQPPFKVHKSVKNVNPSNSIKEPKNFRETSAEKERSPNANSNDPLFQEDDDDVIEEVPIKQEREEYEAEASSSSVPSKEKRPQNQANVDQKSGKESSAEQTEDLSKVEILEEEDCGSNSADQWTGANMGEEENFSYLGDSNSGAAEDMRGQDDTAEGDANEGDDAENLKSTPHILQNDSQEPEATFLQSAPAAPSASDDECTVLSDAESLDSTWMSTKSGDYRYEHINQMRLQSLAYGAKMSSSSESFATPFQSTGFRPSLSITPAVANAKVGVRQEPVTQDYSDKMERLPSGRYRCTICNYEAGYVSGLRIHIRTHSGEKPYKCQFCSHRATTSGNLKTHLRKHTGESPFACSFCDYRSKHNVSLKTHLATVHNITTPRLGAGYAHMLQQSQQSSFHAQQSGPSRSAYNAFNRAQLINQLQAASNPSEFQSTSTHQFSAGGNVQNSPSTNPSPYSTTSLESPASAEQSPRTGGSTQDDS